MLTGYPETFISFGIIYRGMESRTARASQARRERGGDTDYELYELISDHPGMSVYELAKTAGWTHGRTHSAVMRLEKDKMIRVSRELRGGRGVLIVEPLKWWEMMTPEELEEFKRMEF